MVLYITIRFSIHSGAGLGWNPVERNREISEYSSNGGIFTTHQNAAHMDACKVAAKEEFTVLAEKGMLHRKALVTVPFFTPTFI